jgi:hypothetical protein
MDASEIRNKIEEAFVIVILSARETFMQQRAHRSSFELFGFDVMLDAAGNIYILEVNVTPAMGTSSKLDLFVKGPVLRDLFNIALVPKLSESHTRIEQVLKKNESQKDIDFIHIAEYEMVQRRLGMFRCIYPTPDRIKNLSHLMENKTRADVALEEWLLMTEKDRAEYIRQNSDSFVKICGKPEHSREKS